MRRVITTLAILLVVVVAGLTALVMLVNPNDFRSYMVQQVEQRIGYQLTINGDLRWHVWPKLSILAGRMSLTAPGAAQPVVSADNMRLDVNLLPLLSHQLSVSQVMLKNAVVRLTPDRRALAQVVEVWVRILVVRSGLEIVDRVEVGRTHRDRKANAYRCVGAASNGAR